MVQSKPKEKLFYKGAKNSYEKKPNNLNENFELKINGTYVDLYVDELTNRVLISIRGTNTTDFKDLYADFNISFDNLENTQRFKNDNKKIKQIIKLYPPNQYRYYITGHSLGGALVSLLMKKYPFIRYAINFNSANQQEDLPPNQNPKIKYIYM